ncbi:MAG: ferrous iron transport protein A [Desulfobacteraceae bacterium]|nr:ferrous iron transport protein A [Desulfobacteraceae bacterium]
MSETKVDMNKAGFAANRISLAQMQTGQRGKIVEINGGYGLAQKLDALGIRTGKEITKISAQLMRGPVLLRQNNTQVAVGFGMASKVLVEINREG